MNLGLVHVHRNWIQKCFISDQCALLWLTLIGELYLTQKSNENIKAKNHCLPVWCSLYHCKLLAEYKENIVEELYIHKNFILFLQEKMAHLFSPYVLQFPRNKKFTTPYTYLHCNCISLSLGNKSLKVTILHYEINSILW